MEGNNEVEIIKTKLETNDYLLPKELQGPVREDMEKLFQLLANRNDEINRLKKMNETFSRKILELNQEIENVKSDFGSPFR